MSSYKIMTDASDDALTSSGEPRSFSEEPFHRFDDSTAVHPVWSDRSTCFVERIDPEVHELAEISQNSVNGKVIVTVSSPRYGTAPRSAHPSCVAIGFKLHSVCIICPGLPVRIIVE